MKLTICLSLIGFNGFSQEIKSPTLVKVQENGVSVYSSSGYETKTDKNINTERKVLGIDDWTLEECLNALPIVSAKIEHSQELGSMDEVNYYIKQREKINERINILKK